MASSRKTKPEISAKTTRPSVKAAKATASARKAAPPPAGRSAGSIRLTCRECFEEWTLDPARAGEVIACPVCEHRAQAPSADLLHQVAVYGGIERKNLVLAAGGALLMVASMVGWVVLTSVPERANDSLQFFGPIGAAFLGFVMTIVFGAKYEKSRYETYF